jgi:hypothetical protein
MGPCIVNIFFLGITNKIQRFTIFLIAVNAVHVSGGFGAGGATERKIRFATTSVRNIYYSRTIKRDTIIMYTEKAVHLQAFPLYETKWKNILNPDKVQMTIWRMRIAC